MLGHALCYEFAMRDSVVVLVVVLALGACKKEPDAKVATYANTDMAIAIARAREGYAAIGELKAGDVATPGIVKRLVHAATVLRVANETATTITAPPLMATPHADFLVATKELKAAVDDMVVAAGLGLAPKFASGHERMMEAAHYWFSWEERFTRQLGEAHVTFVPATSVPPLADDPAPTPPTLPTPEDPAAPPAPPCKAGTEVKHGDKLVACELEKDISILNLICVPGKATFDEADGQIIGCVTDAVFALPYETPVARENVVTCGPGPVTRTKTNGFASCTTLGAVMVGKTTIARQTLVTIGPKLEVTSATSADGTRQCFDPTGALIPCS